MAREIDRETEGAGGGVMRPTVRKALEAIAEALKEPDGGSYWPARDCLDRFGVFHEDMSGIRVINLLVLELLKDVPR